MESTKTYTNRSNARRAGVAAGIPVEQVEITVHKSPKGVRFGWKAKEAPGEPVTTVEQPAPKAKKDATPKVQQEERNGVKRPKPGGLCAAVWAWLDANPVATIKEVKAAAPDHGWNVNNVSAEYYQWRKFNGITGRVKSA